MKDKFTPNQKKSLEDNEVFNLQHPVLGERLRTITKALLVHTDMDVVDIFGGLDAMKVRSCMTLFDAESPDDVFQKVLDGFYKGQYDLKTLNYM